MAELQFTQILPPISAQGLNPGTIYDEIESMGMYAFTLDDESIVVVADYGPVNGKFVQLWVVDYTGAYTVYQTPNLPENSIFYVSACVPGSSGQYTIVVTGNPYTYTFSFQVANLKLNNASSPILIQGNAKLIAPCGIGVVSPQIHYDGVLRYLGAGFYQAFEESSQVYANTYYVSPINGGLTQINSGYVGNTEVSDPWNKLYDQELPGNLFLYGTASNGLAPVFTSVGGSEILYVGGYGVYVDPGENGSCTQTTYQEVVTRYEDMYETPYTRNTNPAIGDTNVPNLIVFSGNPNTINALDLLTGELSSVPCSSTLTGGQNMPSLTNLVLTNKYLFAYTSIGESRGGVVIADAPQSLTPAYFTQSQKLIHSVVNNARPISLTGRYAA